MRARLLILRFRLRLIYAEYLLELSNARRQARATRTYARTLMHTYTHPSPRVREYEVYAFMFACVSAVFVYASVRNLRVRLSHLRAGRVRSI